jgi:hypothetical protein
MRLVTVALQCRWEKTVGSCARIRAPSESHLLIGCRAPKSIDWVASAQSLGLLPGQSSCQINVKDALNARPMVNSRMSVHPNYLHIIYIYICNIHVYIMYIFYHIKKDIYIHTYIHIDIHAFIWTYDESFDVSVFCSALQHSWDLSFVMPCISWSRAPSGSRPVEVLSSFSIHSQVETQLHGHHHPWLLSGNQTWQMEHVASFSGENHL